MTGIVLDFEQHLYGQGLAERTVLEYVKWCKRLARWCVLYDLELATLSAAELRRWIDATAPPGRESRKQAHAAMKHLYTWLGRDDEPWLSIRVPRKRQGNPNPLPDAEATLLRDTAVMMGGREGIATLGLLYTAARAGEVAMWRRDGIDLDAGTIRWWRPKVRDWHTWLLHPVLASELERWLTPDVETFLFPGDRGRPHVTPTTIWTWVRKVADVAGLQDVTPRRLRSTAGSRVANQTRDVQVAAAMMGNSVEVAHRYYTAVADERMLAGLGALDW